MIDNIIRFASFVLDNYSKRQEELKRIEELKRLEEEELRRLEEEELERIEELKRLEELNKIEKDRKFLYHKSIYFADNFVKRWNDKLNGLVECLMGSGLEY